MSLGQFHQIFAKKQMAKSEKRMVKSEE